MKEKKPNIFIRFFRAIGRGIKKLFSKAKEFFKSFVNEESVNVGVSTVIDVVIDTSTGIKITPTKLLGYICKNTAIFMVVHIIWIILKCLLIKLFNHLMNSKYNQPIKEEYSYV